MTTNTGTLSAVPGTLPKLARSCKSSARGNVPHRQLKACSGIFVSGYNSEAGVTGCGSGSLDVALKLVDDHHFPPCQIQGERS